MHLKSESSSGKRRLEVFRAVKQKYGGFDIVFFSHFPQEYLGEGGGSRGKKSDVKQFVRLWISSDGQPELLIVDANHRFVKGNLVRRFPRSGL
jgi:hypothetical protein